jgi:hypothetical protein
MLQHFLKTVWASLSAYCFPCAPSRYGLWPRFESLYSTASWEADVVYRCPLAVGPVQTPQRVHLYQSREILFLFGAVMSILDLNLRRHYCWPTLFFIINPYLFMNCLGLVAVDLACMGWALSILVRAGARSEASLRSASSIFLWSSRILFLTLEAQKWNL